MAAPIVNPRLTGPAAPPIYFAVHSYRLGFREIPMRRFWHLIVFFCAAAAWAQDAEKLAPYYPTPATVVEKMLELGGLRPGETVFDLGSGDGRIVIMAAQRFGAFATGIELDKDLCRQSLERIQKLGLGKNAHIINGDILKQNYSSADLITVYLLPKSNDKVQPLLERQLKKGARVVAHDFEFRNWTPEKVEDIEDDGEGRSHTLYLYRR
jgi:protein-L-isoaspartate O-methyltransferase